MNAPVRHPFAAHKLPAKAPTAKKLAARLVRIANASRSGTLRTDNDACRKLDDLQFDTEDQFYAALERETGIDRRLMQRLGGTL